MNGWRRVVVVPFVISVVAGCGPGHRAAPAGSGSPGTAAVVSLQTSRYVPFAGQVVTLTVEAAAGSGRAPSLRVDGATVVFGDGTAQADGRACTGGGGSGSGLSVRHTYRRAGLVTARVTRASVCGQAGRPDLSTAATAMRVLPAAPAASASWPACVPGQLQVTAGQAGFATGHAGLVFTLRNVSSASCQLRGYPGLRLIGASGSPLPTTAQNEVSDGYLFPAVTPARVALAPDAVASFDLEYEDNPFGPQAGEPYAQACPAAVAVAITLPGPGGVVTVPVSLAPCSGLVLLSAVVPGSARLTYPSG